MRWLCFILALLVLVGANVQAADHIVTTQAELVSAHTAASTGDTITVPGGTTLTLSSTVTMTKNVILRGEGNWLSNEVSTILVNTSANQPGIQWTLAADGPIRVTGLHIDCGGHSGIFFGTQNEANAPMKNVRFDHCTFINAGTAAGTSYHAVKAAGHVYGVGDHNYWWDCVIPFEFDDNDSAAWERSPYPGIGTTNSWTLEDNVFSITNNVDMVFYLSNGARMIFRNNIITNHDSPDFQMVVDAHGNNELVEEDGLRGTIYMQFYSNYWSGRANFALRGGHMLVFSNAFVNQPFDNTIIGLTEEEFCREDLIGPGYTPYPAGDMITNSFFWANTSDGNPTAPFLYCDEPNPAMDMIEEGRDYWLRAPQSGDSANVFPLPLLVYPHPRVTADDGGPPPEDDGLRYVDGATGDDGDAGTIDAPWATIGKANATVEAGQTVYIKEGHYTDAGISPAVTGTAANPITYQAFEDDVVVIEEVTLGIDMNDKNFVTISGIQFTNVDGFYRILGGTNNTITNCTFKYMRTLGQWGGGVFEESSQSNLVTHSWFEKWGQQDTEDEGSLLDFGDEADATDFTWYNRVEFCTLIHGGHDLINLRSGHNIIRSNYLRNDASSFMNDLGNRGIISHTSSALGGWNLIEGNRIAWSAPSVDSPENNAGINLRTDNNIVRGNLLYENSGAGISIDSGNADSIGSTNAIYHNVFYRNGLLGTDNAHVILQNWGSGFVIVSNAFKNNIFRSADNIFDVSGTGVSINNQFVAGNLESGDPLFEDVTTSYDSEDQNLPDLSLQSGSPARDAGVFLCAITSASGSGTSFVVDNPHYFQDGWGGITADSIQLEGQTTTVLITDIDYETRTITFTPSLTWTQGDGVALPFNGIAPDQGAFELSALSEEYNGAIKPSSGIRASQGVIFK